ncbi:MAG: pyridoxamine 5'-phosphate oxidase family protein [Candidatus Peribacteraceae bacterium]|nr:pyridoxamine 5'-phosphate oxidase family protein [Candidatus Peribacteraceae bacterium]
MQLTNDERATILKFMKKNPMAVISTSDAKTGHPEAALIAFAETDDLEIVFETDNDARKYENLLSHPAVALVIGWDLSKYQTLQYEGAAAEVTAEEFEQYKALILKKKTPCTEEFLRPPRARIFKVRPTWIRLSDYTGECPVIIEGTI